MTEKNHFKNADRQQQSVLTPIEKQVLQWLAFRMPAWVNSDHLTVLGFLGMILTGICYYLSASNPNFLLLACVCLGINWFGDSLDGTLARVRKRLRPRYGFYVDHIVDAFGVTCVMAGLGSSGYMSPSIAMTFLIAYFLVNIETYLATYTIGVFKLSYGILGPTELRVIVCIGNIALTVKNTVTIAGKTFLLCDVSGVIGAVALLGIAIVSTIRNTKHLYNEERLP